ncbi:hypothetical protein K438DRAFT_720977 [Mycena galopus ATCC 62051]|nr:hypothetical protein K438DRAFT_720977 [Mycena galopus ATCC 62051]
MKFILNILTISCLYIATVWAQGVQIGSPLPGATLEFDSTFTFQLIRPNFIESATEVGIAVGLVSCPDSVCPSPEGELGEILYTGPFNPTLHAMGMFYENFTLTVPSSDFFSGTGPAQLAVVRFYLIGAGPAPTSEIENITVNLEN